MNDKNPHMRFQVLEWLNKSVSKLAEEKNGGILPSERQKDGYRNIESLAQRLNSDGASEVRDAARKVLQSFGILLDK